MSDSFHFLRMPQLLFKTLALGDILRQTKQSFKISRVGHQRRIEPLTGDDSTIFGEVFIDRVSRHVTLTDAAEDVVGLRHCVWGEDLLERWTHSQDLGFEISEDSLSGLVPVDDAEIRVELDVCQRHPFDLKLQTAQ